MSSPLQIVCCLDRGVKHPAIRPLECGGAKKMKKNLSRISSTARATGLSAARSGVAGAAQCNPNPQAGCAHAPDTSVSL